MVTARLASMTSGAGSAIAGLRVAESMESGAYAHMGRIPQGAYNGYFWTSIAGGGGGGVPSGVSNGNWIRIVRRGDSITAYRAPDASGSPGAWTQLGQPQTVIMTTPVFVGFYVNNASGVGLNTATFTGLSIVPLNKAPVVDAGAVSGSPILSTPLDATVTDDGQPAPISLGTQWSLVSGPPGLAFANASATDTTATFSLEGTYTLRLTADDGAVRSFGDVTFAGYMTRFGAWQGANFTGGSSHPDAAWNRDPDCDGALNLIEYATGTDPNQPSASAVVQDLETVGADRYLRLTITKNPNATELTYLVEATSTLHDPQSWSTAGLVIEVNDTTTLRVRDHIPIGAAPARYLRGRVTTP